jgi:glycerol-3-phosphate dehydrogenase
MVLRQTWRDTFLITTAIVHGQCVPSLNQQAKVGLYTENDCLLLTHVRYCLAPFVRLLTLPLPLVIDAEVRYAVRHEYALTAIDVLARRTRLSFLNARAALDALPRVVDIMADELGWSYKERKNQISKGIQFLGSMGLSPAFMTSAFIPEPEPRGMMEHMEKALWKVGTGVVHVLGLGSTASHDKAYGRSKFEGGEVAALRNAFISHARAQRGDVATSGELKLRTEVILEILKDVTGYSEISKKELNYVLGEAGLEGHGEVDFDEFIEASLSFGASRGLFVNVLVI